MSLFTLVQTEINLPECKTREFQTHDLPAYDSYQYVLGVDGFFRDEKTGRIETYLDEKIFLYPGGDFVWVCFVEHDKVVDIKKVTDEEAWKMGW